jgi:hypothetical protein
MALVVKSLCAETMTQWRQHEYSCHVKLKLRSTKQNVIFSWCIFVLCFVLRNFKLTPIKFCTIRAFLRSVASKNRSIHRSKLTVQVTIRVDFAILRLTVSIRIQYAEMANILRFKSTPKVRRRAKSSPKCPILEVRRSRAKR